MTIKRFEIGPRMSQAALYNNTVYLAGQVGNPGETVAEQTATILAKIDKLLADTGSHKSKILSATIWLASMDDFAQMNAVWDAWVEPGHTPTRAAGESRLATPDYLVEVIIVAAAE